MEQRNFTVLQNAELAKGTWLMLLSGDTSSITRPGQFVDLRLEGRFLRRPISVCSWTEDTLTLIYKVVGTGTEQMSAMAAGERLDLLTGLGNGFDVTKAGERPLLVGGGAGAAPLYGLAQKLVEAGCHPSVVLGFNTEREVFLTGPFEQLDVPTAVTTVDGSFGKQGFVPDALPGDATYLYACGPMPMLKALYSKTELDGQFSFEARMGCGFGACMGCSMETKNGYKRICKDGPVFERGELLW